MFTPRSEEGPGCTHSGLNVRLLSACHSLTVSNGTVSTSPPSVNPRQKGSCHRPFVTWREWVGRKAASADNDKTLGLSGNVFPALLMAMHIPHPNLPRRVPLYACYSRVITKSAPGLPWWLHGKESACWCQCRRHKFDPWSGKMPHAMEQLNPWAATTEPVL